MRDEQYYTRRYEWQSPYIEGCKIYLDLNEREARQCLKIYAALLKNNMFLEQINPELAEKQKEFADKLLEFIETIEATIEDNIEFDKKAREEGWLEKAMKKKLQEKNDHEDIAD